MFRFWSARLRLGGLSLGLACLLVSCGKKPDPNPEIEAPNDRKLKSRKREVDPCANNHGDVFVVGGDGRLASAKVHDEGKLEFAVRGTLSCAANTPYSMAIDAKGVAFVLDSKGTIHRIMLDDLPKTPGTILCLKTPMYVPKAEGTPYFLFGMAIAGPRDAQILFAIDRDSHELGSMDMKTFTLTPLGSDPVELGPWELAVSPDGRMFGWSPEGPLPRLAEFNPKTGKVISSKSVADITVGTSYASTVIAMRGQKPEFLLLSGKKPGGSEALRYTLDASKQPKPESLELTVVGAGMRPCIGE